MLVGERSIVKVIYIITNSRNQGKNQKFKLSQI